MSGVYYVPIVRSGFNERRVFNRIGGLSRFEDAVQENRLLPLVETTSEEDIKDFQVYRRSGVGLMVDLPIYHYLTEAQNELGPKVQSLADDYESQLGFYDEELDEIDIPVVSDSIVRPLNYQPLLDKYRKLQGSFAPIAVRVFVSSRRLDELQRDVLGQLSSEMEEGDFVLLDYVDAGVVGAVRDNLSHLSQLFRNQNVIVMNIFDPIDNPENHSLKLSREINADGFGDFATDSRFEVSYEYDGPKKIRHYHPQKYELIEFEGDSYEEASRELREWDAWDGNHCKFCSDADRGDVGEDTWAWKRIRMGHYVTSALSEEV